MRSSLPYILGAAAVLAVLTVALLTRGDDRSPSVTLARMPTAAGGTPEVTAAAGSSEGTATAPAAGSPTPETTAPSPPASATSLPVPPTTDEAVAVVREYFRAIEADSYSRMRAATLGRARQKTEALIAEVERQEASEGVNVDLHVAELKLTPFPTTATRVPVWAKFVVEAYADAGFTLVKVREIRSQGAFNVAHVAGGTKIVDIEGELVP